MSGIKNTDQKSGMHIESCVSNAVREFAGISLIVFFGCTASLVAGPSIGAIGIALTFSILYFFLVMMFGGIQSVQLNPGLTLSLYFSQNRLMGELNGQSSLAERITFGRMLLKLIAQFIGAVFGAFCVVLLLKARIYYLDPGQMGLAQNGWGVGFGAEYTWRAAFVVETLGAASFFAIIICGLGRHWQPVVVAACGAMAFFAMHLFTYPFTGASLNFARSLGPEIVAWFAQFLNQPGGIGSDAAFNALCNSGLELLLFGVAAISASVLAYLYSAFHFKDVE